MKYIIILLVLVSCSSAKKQAKKLTEQGRHEEALVKWLEAYTRSPKDEDVIEGLRQCQENVLNDRLVKVRDLRIAKDEEGALVKLKSVVDFQQQYNFKLDYNSSGFQGKETSALWPYHKLKITELVQRKLPLAAEFRYITYHQVFMGIKDEKALGSSVSALGATQCKSLAKSTPASYLFVRSFVAQFCQHYSAGQVNINAPIAQQLFKSLETDSNMLAATPDQRAILSKYYQQKFAESPWYHAEGSRPARAALSGTFGHDLQKTDIIQAHSYTEKEPYTEYVTENRTRLEPVQRMVNGQLTTVHENKSYTEQVGYTKYRDVTRIHRYQARRLAQAFNLSLQGRVDFAETIVPFTFAKNEQADWIEHDQNMPAIGLRPSRSQALNVGEKFSAYAELGSATFLADLNRGWKDQFCKPPKVISQFNSGEAAIKCKRMKEYPTEFVDPWFKDNFGVTAAEAIVVVGKF